MARLLGRDVERAQLVGALDDARQGHRRVLVVQGHVRRVCDLRRPHTTIPVHYEGWSHFRERQSAARSALDHAGDAVRSSVRWIPLGVPIDVEE